MTNTITLSRPMDLNQADEFASNLTVQERKIITDACRKANLADLTDQANQLIAKLSFQERATFYRQLSGRSAMSYLHSVWPEAQSDLVGRVTFLLYDRFSCGDRVRVVNGGMFQGTETVIDRAYGEGHEKEYSCDVGTGTFERFYAYEIELVEKA